jgi:hypothetical protein
MSGEWRYKRSETTSGLLFLLVVADRHRLITVLGHPYRSGENYYPEDELLCTHTASGAYIFEQGSRLFADRRPEVLSLSPGAFALA